MNINNITFYSVKSTRKNAKATYNTWATYIDEDIKGIKNKYTDIDYLDMRDWLDKQPYNLYRMVVYHGHTNLNTWNNKVYYNKEDILKHAREFMGLINNYKELEVIKV